MVRLPNWLSAPERVFLLLSLVGGLVLAAMIPPLAGGNETFNFQRAAAIASGHLMVGPAVVPKGVTDIIEVTHRNFPEGRSPPYSYSRADFDQVAAIPLARERPTVLEPNPIAVLHPLPYLPQAPAIALGQLLGLSPLALVYLGRLAGMLAGIALTFWAIRAIPVHKHALAAIALLPPLLFTRSTLDADQLTNGLAFLFLALILREVAGEGRMARGTLAGLAVAAFLVAQAKSAYLLLPLLSVAIPAARFGSARDKWLACALICLPGLIASGAWMVALKLGAFADVRYRTWSGVVSPDEQFRLIVSDPLGYAATVLKTVFATAFIPHALVGMLGVFGPPVSMPLVFYPAVAVALAALFIAEPKVAAGRLASAPVRSLAIAIALASVLVILTLLYLQWTRLGAPVIEGFNGRYLYPLAPLALILIPPGGTPLLGLSPGRWLLLLGTIAVAATWWTSWTTYLA